MLFFYFAIFPNRYLSSFFILILIMPGFSRSAYFSISSSFFKPPWLLFRPPCFPFFILQLGLPSSYTAYHAGIFYAFSWTAMASSPSLMLFHLAFSWAIMAHEPPFMLVFLPGFTSNRDTSEPSSPRKVWFHNSHFWKHPT